MKGSRYGTKNLLVHLEKTHANLLKTAREEQKCEKDQQETKVRDCYLT